MSIILITALEDGLDIIPINGAADHSNVLTILLNRIEVLNFYTLTNIRPNDRQVKKSKEGSCTLLIYITHITTDGPDQD